MGIILSPVSYIIEKCHGPKTRVNIRHNEMYGKIRVINN
jgi:hypothetical protein